MPAQGMERGLRPRVSNVDVTKAISDNGPRCAQCRRTTPAGSELSAHLFYPLPAFRAKELLVLIFGGGFCNRHEEGGNGVDLFCDIFGYFSV